jgi:nitrogen regulatory protein P-II 1
MVFRVTVSKIKRFSKSRVKNAKDKIIYEIMDVNPGIELEAVVNTK